MGLLQLGQQVLPWQLFLCGGKRVRERCLECSSWWGVCWSPEGQARIKLPQGQNEDFGGGPLNVNGIARL